MTTATATKKATTAKASTTRKSRELRALEHDMELAVARAAAKEAAKPKRAPKATSGKKAEAKKSTAKATRNGEAIKAVLNWKDGEGYGRQTEHYVRETFGVHEFVPPTISKAKAASLLKAFPAASLVLNPQPSKEEARLCALCGYRPKNSLHAVSE